MQVRIRVIPGSKKRNLEQGPQGDYRIKVASPPEGGKANEEAIAMLAAHLRIPRSRISLIRGRTHRDKVVEVED